MHKPRQAIRLSSVGTTMIITKCSSRHLARKFINEMESKSAVSLASVSHWPSFNHVGVRLANACRALASRWAQKPGGAEEQPQPPPFDARHRPRKWPSSLVFTPLHANRPLEQRFQRSKVY
ncbi:hypothetical protein AA313_de0209361 [Arthrobotrys entomopaga]|nr:hypothetical protein AA313_de0209361 [Arthrobotrys entomopaga]